MQAARTSVPRDVSEEIRLLQKRIRAKQNREEANMITKVQKERQKRYVEYRVETWKDRKLVSTEIVTEIEEEEEEEDPELDEEGQVCRTT